MLHNMGKYGDLPIWAAVEMLSFGATSKAYGNLADSQIKERIAKSFGTTPYYLKSWLEYFTQIEDHTLNYLFHIMLLEFPKIMGGRKYQSMVTVFDETTGDYYAKDCPYKACEVESSTEERFRLKAPNGLMEGDWGSMRIVVHEPEANFKLDTTVSAIHYPIVSGGTSKNSRHYEMLRDAHMALARKLQGSRLGSLIFRQRTGAKAPIPLCKFTATYAPQRHLA